MQVMGFKLNCKEDLEALKNIVPGYKEESHVHELIIPSETAVWNEEDKQEHRPGVPAEQHSHQEHRPAGHTEQQQRLGAERQH